MSAPQAQSQVAQVVFKCPSCQCDLSIDAGLFGQQMICPGCHGLITIPVPHAATAVQVELQPPQLQIGPQIRSVRGTSRKRPRTWLPFVGLLTCFAAAAAVVVYASRKDTADVERSSTKQRTSAPLKSAQVVEQANQRKAKPENPPVEPAGLTPDERETGKEIIGKLIQDRAKEESAAASVVGYSALTNKGITDFESSARIQPITGTKLTRWEVQGQGVLDTRPVSFRIEIDTTDYELGDSAKENWDGVKIVSFVLDGKPVQSAGSEVFVGSWACDRAPATSGPDKITVSHALGLRADGNYMWLATILDNNKFVESLGKWTFAIDEEISNKRGTTTGLLKLVGGPLEGPYVATVIGDQLVLKKLGDPDPDLMFKRLESPDNVAGLGLPEPTSSCPLKISSG